MKLFLTSVGIVSEITDEFLKLLGKNPKNAKLVYIPTASDPEPDRSYANEDIKRLQELGFAVASVDLKDQNQDSLTQKFEGADVVFVEGGNTFYLLDWVRKSEFDTAVKKFLEREGVYVGVSAGSVIAGLNIEPAGWKHADRNIVDLKDLTGMGLVPFLITPHYTAEVAEIVKESAATCGKPTIALTDQQAVWVYGNRIKIVGPGEKLVFDSRDIRLKRLFLIEDEIFDMRTKNDSDEEIETKKLLTQALGKYSFPAFTNEIVIEKNTISHSHPILTLGTSWIVDGKRTSFADIGGEFPALSVFETFIHEQFHWFLMRHPKFKEAIAFLQQKYKDTGDFTDPNNKLNFWVHLIILWNTRNWLNKNLPAEQVKTIYSAWRPYPLTEKFIKDNFDQLRADLGKFHMIYEAGLKE
jgi:dipeptidase E